ncbi:MAG: caspase family protein [Tyzzerella sp.]|nr:caspase family protein [Tyzzerella sp.]
MSISLINRLNIRIILFLCLTLNVTSVIAQSKDLIKRANKGEAEAQFRLGKIYYDSKDYTQALHWFTKSAEQGNYNGLSAMGTLYRNGHGVTQDFNKAIVFFIKAYNKGNEKVASSLAHCYLRIREFKQSKYWAIKAAEQGNIDQIIWVANSYSLGTTGFEKDSVQAAYWTLKAAEKGDIGSQDRIADYYKIGYGLDKDISKALYWYQKAADQGNVHAQERLFELRSQIATIDWLLAQDTVTEPSCEISVGIKSNSQISNAEIIVNGQTFRGINAVQNDGYDMKLNKNVNLQPGQNIVKVNVTNTAGTTTLEKYITYNAPQPQPQPNPVPVITPDIKDDYGKRLALIIGNSNYAAGQMLKNPTNDATDIANKLESLGFDVMLAVNATHEQMDMKIEEFGTKAHQYDVALFYYAGHGIQSKGTNYLLPVDAQLQSEEQLRYRCTPTNYVLDKLDASGCKMKIVILDACRNNPFERSWHRGANSRGLSIMNAPRGTLIAYATAPGDVANDGEGRNSPYTEAILTMLNKPGVKLLDFFQGVTEQVIEATNTMQYPWTSQSITGTFYFNKNKQ